MLFLDSENYNLQPAGLASEPARFASLFLQRVKAGMLLTAAPIIKYFIAKNIFQPSVCPLEVLNLLIRFFFFFSGTDNE